MDTEDEDEEEEPCYTDERAYEVWSIDAECPLCSCGLQRKRLKEDEAVEYEITCPSCYFKIKLLGDQRNLRGINSEILQNLATDIIDILKKY
ncbi:MAG: hypothetical protein FWG65_13085 [Turicibacter sp.]|nr:hypothetical protein [Turicibacter sp.]